MAKVTGPNQFSLAVGHQTTAKVDDCKHKNITELLCFILKITMYKSWKACLVFYMLYMNKENISLILIFWSLLNCHQKVNTESVHITKNVEIISISKLFFNWCILGKNCLKAKILNLLVSCTRPIVRKCCDWKYFLGDLATSFF